MNSLQLSEDDLHFFQPPCFKHLCEYSGPDNWTARNLPHPRTIFVVSWRRVQITLGNLLDVIDENTGLLGAATPRTSNNRHITKILDAHRDFIYAAAEFIEAITEKVPESCLPNPRSKKFSIKGIDALKRHSEIICNQLKHNSHELMFVEYIYTDTLFAFGYRVCRHIGETLKPNPHIHKDQEAFSIPLDIHRVLAQLHLIAARVAEAFDDHPDYSATPVDTKHDTKSDKTLLQRVSRLTLTAFPDEKPVNCPSIVFDEDRLKIHKTRASLPPRGQSGRVRAIFSGNGVTKSFQIPYGPRN